MALAGNVINMEERRSAGPQLEDGYIRIANELFDAVLSKLGSYRHIKVVLAILRKTYGYQKKEDDITVSQLSELTGVHRNHVGGALRELEAMHVINSVRPGAYGLILGLNKHHSEWTADVVKVRGTPRKEATKLVAPPEDNQFSCLAQLKQLHDATKTLHGGNQNVAHNIQPQKTTPKDNPNKAQSDDCDAAFAQFWDAFALKKDRQNAERAFRKLMQAQEDPAALLDTLLVAATKEAQRRPHLIADGRTPIYAQGWLNGRRFEDEDLASWGEYTPEQAAFVAAFNENVGDACPAIDEWTERRAALIDVALAGKWDCEQWAGFWRRVRDECEFRWPVSLEWMLDRENFAKVKAGQYKREARHAPTPENFGAKDYGAGGKL